MSLPNAFHIGAAKCASTWLYHACLEHPEIHSAPENDNLNFFLLHYDRGLDWYERTYFADRTVEPVSIDFSNAYMLSDIALDRIAEHVPDAKLTCIIRDPVERAYLHWAHSYYRSGRPPADPKTDSGNPLDAAPNRPTGRTFAIPLDVVRHPNGWVWARCWLEPGLYAAHLKRVLHRFPRERVLISFYEDVRDDPEAFLETYFDFLDVDPTFRPACTYRQINPDTSDTDIAELSDDLVAELRAFFHADVSALSVLTDRDLTRWH